MRVFLHVSQLGTRSLNTTIVCISVVLSYVAAIFPHAEPKMGRVSRMKSIKLRWEEELDRLQQRTTGNAVTKTV